MYFFSNRRGFDLKVFITALLICTGSTAAMAGSPLFQDLNSDAFATIDEYREPGKWLVVMIWAHDCQICEREVDDYQRFHQRQSEGDAKVLGITLDGEARKSQALDFISRHQLRFDNLIAEPEVVAGYYQLTTGSRWVGTPSFLIFAPDGELMAKQAGAVEVEIVENFIAANSQTE
ncbi:MAG: TlpA family protein disulfide reductase [Gammaproteobacteria bacterium]|nr:TlpA family protein disulfide reductase [Gammaproteobacteria bacterium]